MQELDVGSSPALPLPFKVVTLTKPPERMGQRAPLSPPLSRDSDCSAKGRVSSPM